MMFRRSKAGQVGGDYRVIMAKALQAMLAIVVKSALKLIR